MTVRELLDRTGFAPIALPQPDRTIAGGYAGDLLSWVMGNAFPDCAWVTIMTNRNIIAVAALIDMAVIILAEGCELTEELQQLACDQGVNICTAPQSAYEICAALSKLL